MNMVRSRALSEELPFISVSPKLRLPVMFARKRQPLLQGTNSLFSPKAEMLGTKLHTLLESEIFEVSNGFSYFGICDCVFPLCAYLY